MKTICLIGGMSWESTASYYKIINEEIKKSLGGLHSSKCILYSVDFHKIEICQSNNEWDKSTDILIDAAKRLEIAGADFIIICTNTMHKVANKIQSLINIPIINIADATIKHLIKHKIKSVALLGTKYTMEQDFYKERLINNNIEVLIPKEEDRSKINQIIYDELCKGIINKNSKRIYLSIIDKLVKSGAKAVILGCTEIGLLISQKDCSVKIFDTTLLHAKEAVCLSIKTKWEA